MFSFVSPQGIFCSHTRSVAAAGRINCLAFDKTGTLTEDGLRLHSAQVGGLFLCMISVNDGYLDATVSMYVQVAVVFSRPMISVKDRL
jgi:magnesium-transporting ATPase (P-type)